MPGACCYIKFNKGITPKTSKLSWTLNINSTGAYYFRQFTRLYQTGFIWEWRSNATYIAWDNISTGTASTATATIVPPISNALFIYDGSYYTGCCEAVTATYSDYSDYQD